MSVTAVLMANAPLHVPLFAAFDSVHATPSGLLVMLPPPADPVPADTVNTGGAANAAVTLLVTPGAVVIVQARPAHAPEYPENDDRPDAVAVSATAVLTGKFAEQLPLTIPAVTTQLMPDGILVTLPFPLPPPDTVTP